MLLFLDTETSDKPDFKTMRASDPRQPHIVSLGYIVTDDEGNETDSFYEIAVQDGWRSVPEAQAVHKITPEISQREGIPEKEIMAKAMPVIYAANRILAYNKGFDKYMLRIGQRRFGMEFDDAKWKVMPFFDIMPLLAPVCKLPFKDGSTRKFGHEWKFPKLEEAYLHAFGKEFNAHHALDDVRAVKDIFFWMVKNGIGVDMSPK